MNQKSLWKFAGHVAALLVAGLVVMITVYPSRARTLVYISNADSREIYVLELNEKNGSLKIIEKIAVAGTVMPLAVSPDRKFLYASLRSEPYSVSSFAIDRESGRLKFLKTTPLADNMAYLSTDRTGHYLFAASYHGHKISVNAILPNGEINPAPLHVISTGKNAHCILTDPSNKFLFASNLGEDRLLQYSFDEKSGGLTANDPPTVETRKGAGPRHFIFHPNGRFVFGINELDGTVNTYRLNSSGTLEVLGSTSIMGVNSGVAPRAADLHLTPDGKFLYASERATSTITAFRVNEQDGKLKLIDNYPTETEPRGFNIAPEGRYLLVAGQKSNSVSVYEIDRQTGTLHRKSQMELGKAPNWVEIIKLPKR